MSMCSCARRRVLCLYVPRAALFQTPHALNKDLDKLNKERHWRLQYPPMQNLSATADKKMPQLPRSIFKKKCEHGNMWLTCSELSSGSGAGEIAHAMCVLSPCQHFISTNGFGGCAVLCFHIWHQWMHLPYALVMMSLAAGWRHMLLWHHLVAGHLCGVHLVQHPVFLLTLLPHSSPPLFPSRSLHYRCLSPSSALHALFIGSYFSQSHLPQPPFLHGMLQCGCLGLCAGYRHRR